MGEKLKIVKKLNDFAKSCNQSLAQMALVWLLKDKRVTSVIIGASSIKQLEENIRSFDNRSFSKDELNAIDLILSHSIAY
jgi:L-glyceraldehyde 3-phosphate reductase